MSSLAALEIKVSSQVCVYVWRAGRVSGVGLKETDRFYEEMVKVSLIVNTSVGGCTDLLLAVVLHC